MFCLFLCIYCCPSLFICLCLYLSLALLGVFVFRCISLFCITLSLFWHLYFCCMYTYITLFKSLWFLHVSLSLFLYYYFHYLYFSTSYFVVSLLCLLRNIYEHIMEYTWQSVDKEIYIHILKSINAYVYIQIYLCL